MKPFHPNGGSLEKVQENDFPWWRDWTGRIFRPSVFGLGLVFAVTAYAGANIVAFERLEGRLAGEEIVSGRPGQAQPYRELWRAGKIPPVSPRGLAASRSTSSWLKLQVTAAAIDNALRELAEGSPTSVAAWQALVAYRGTTRRSEGKCAGGISNVRSHWIARGIFYDAEGDLRARALERFARN